MGIQNLVLRHHFLRLVVAPDQKPVGWEDLGVNFGLFLGVLAVPGSLQLGGYRAGIYRHHSSLHDARKRDFLGHLRIRSRCIDHGKDSIPFFDR